MQSNACIIRALSLEEFLTKHPMSHENLARLLGVGVDAVHSWSCGRRSPRPQILTHLATIDERFVINPEMRQAFVKAVPSTAF